MWATMDMSAVFLPLVSLTTVFTESATRPIQSLGCKVCLLFVCLFVCPLLETTKLDYLPHYARKHKAT